MHTVIFGNLHKLWVAAILYITRYAPIGNRTSSSEGGATASPPSRLYTANNLNQYTARTVPPTVSIIGSAPLDVDIHVNGEEAGRQGTYWYSCITVNNVPSAVYAEIETLGIRTPPAPQDPPTYTITTNHVFVAQSPETFTYDLDGNMTSDGRFTYTWNAENRLIMAETRNDLPPEVPRYRVEYSYDHQGRMVSKAISRATTNNYELITNNCYTWDNWNIIAETTATSNNSELITNNCYYVWGVDLSGTLQGAGGVGGLLAVVNTNGIFAPTYDANGNVSEYICQITNNSELITEGAIAAHYEYDPFGNTVVQCGDFADSFAFRFSTKYFEAETSIVRYELRPYLPPLGRWMCNDPIGEQGGLNLYGFVRNNPVNKWDKLGLWCNGTIISGPTIKEGAEWKLHSVTFDINKNTALNPGTVATSLLTDVNVTWRLEGNVKCCCKIPGAEILGSWPWPFTFTTYKTKTTSAAFNPFILGFSQKGPFTIPTPVTLLDLIGELVAFEGGNIVTDVGSTVFDPVNETVIRKTVEELLSQKPTTPDEGDWESEPCK